MNSRYVKEALGLTRRRLFYSGTVGDVWKWTPPCGTLGDTWCRVDPVKWRVKGRETGRAHVTRQCVLALAEDSLTYVGTPQLVLPWSIRPRPVRSLSCEVLFSSVELWHATDPHATRRKHVIHTCTHLGRRAVHCAERASCDAGHSRATWFRRICMFYFRTFATPRRNVDKATPAIHGRTETPPITAGPSGASRPGHGRAGKGCEARQALRVDGLTGI